MTLLHAVRCPHCHNEQIVKRGKTARGTQRYLCQNITVSRRKFSAGLPQPRVCARGETHDH